MKCDCFDWQENIEKVNAPLMLQAARSGFDPSVRYDGKQFTHCPWCGNPLKASEADSVGRAGNQGAALITQTQHEKELQFSQAASQQFSPLPAPQGASTLSVLLEEIEQRANAATPGPWIETHHFPRFNIRKGDANGRCIASTSDDQEGELDMRFIIAARTDVPALVKALRRAVWTIDNPPPGNPELDCYWQEVDKTKAEIFKLLQPPAESVRDKNL